MPRAQNVKGRAVWREAAKSTKNGRPAHVEGAARLSASHVAGMMSRSERQTRLGQTGALRPTAWGRSTGRSVRGVRRVRRPTPTVRRLPNGRSDQLRPSDCARCAKRSTPLAGRVSCGGRTNVNLRTRWTGPRTKDQRQHRRLGPRRLRRACHSAGPAFPHGPPGESESSSGQARATGITHPGFYGRKPWKSLTVSQLSPLPPPQERAWTPPPARPPQNRSIKFTATGA